MSIDERRLEELVETAITDIGAVSYAPLALVGDRLGLFDALAEAGPLTPSELAERTDTHERYVREWLAASAAGEYVTYDAEADRYDLSPEQELLLTDSAFPEPLLVGLYQLATSAGNALPDIERGFRTGEGVGWHEHDDGVFEGMMRTSQFGFHEHLVSDWIPALDGVEESLQEGARVADIGCGQGESTIVMAEAYPESTFVGYDLHDASLAAARERAAEAGVSERVDFEVANAKDFGGTGYDLVTTFDCLHDMGDPVGVAEHIRETIDDGGTWMIGEPLSGEEISENLNPEGRMMASFSTMLCTPNALDQEGPHALGALAGESQIRDVVTAGGFSHFRKATETPPLDVVFEAKP